MINKYSYSYSPAHPLRPQTTSHNFGETRFLVGLMLIVSLIIFAFLIFLMFFPKNSQSQQLKSPVIKTTAYV